MRSALKDVLVTASQPPLQFRTHRCELAAPRDPERVGGFGLHQGEQLYVLGTGHHAYFGGSLFQCRTADTWGYVSLPSKLRAQAGKE